LLLAHGARTLEVLERLAVPRALERLDALVEHKLLRIVGGAYASSIPVITDAKAGELRSALVPLASVVARVVERRMGELESAYSRTALSGEFAWSDVAHGCVDALLLDLSMLSCLENLRAREGLFRDWSEEQLAIPFFGMEVGPNLTNFGVNSMLLDGFGMSIMHGSIVRREIYLSQFVEVVEKERSALAELCRGSYTGGVPRGLVELGLVRASRGCYEPAVPMLRDRDKELMTEVVVAIAHEAAEELVRRYDRIEMAFVDLGYSRRLEGMGDFAELALHVVMALSIEELVDRGVLPRIPEEAPPNWGVWLWSRPWTLDLGVLYRHTLGELAEIVDRLGARSDVEAHISSAEALARRGEYGNALAELEKAIDIYKRSQALET